MRSFSFSDEENIFPPFTVLTFLLLLVMIFSILGAGIIYGINAWMGSSFESILESIQIESSVEDRNQVRFSIIINHLFTFVFPALVLAIFLFRKKWHRALNIHQPPKAFNMGLGTLFILAALPLAQFTFWLNKQIPLPEWATSMESATNDLVNNLLVAEYPYELALNLLVVAIIPAIGEEFIFRGILQKNLHRAIKNPHIAIWLTGILFSTIHLQFEGFIPRMVLGALLGYLFFWTKNLWIPIIAHFANNGLQVYVQYLYQHQQIDYNPDQIEQVPWSISIFSFIFVMALGYAIYQYNQRINNS